MQYIYNEILKYNISFDMIKKMYCINIFILEKKIQNIGGPFIQWLGQFCSNLDVDSHPRLVVLFFYSLVKTICSLRYYLDYLVQ